MSRRSNNVRRTELNKSCRQQLSAHIYNRLGIFIDPSQVRLRRDPNDPYIWEAMQGKEYLVSKNLSDLSTGQLLELYNAIDKSIVAVWRPLRTDNQSSLHFPIEELSFKAKINALSQENIRLSSELNKWKDAAAVESKTRQTIELKISQSAETILRYQMDNERLQKYVNEWKAIAEEAKSSAVRHCREMRKVYIALEEVNSEFPCTHVNHEHT